MAITECGEMQENDIRGLGLFAPLPEDFPNRLRTEPDRGPLKSAVGILAVLVLLCLLLRIWMAATLTSVCPDGVFYIGLAKAIEQGNLQEGIHSHGLNTFPLILAALHHLGLDWELAGKLWGIVISSLVVLPLFGWVRRQFDDRVAVVACLLYAFHPTLIRWSPEIIRDSTFWFLLSLSLYLLWRSLVEARPWMYLLAVATIVVATMTRLEGLFLAAPLVIWTTVRVRALSGSRFHIRWAIWTSGLILALICAGVGLASVHSGKTPVYTMGTLKLAQAWISTHLHVSWITMPADDSIRLLVPGESTGRILETLIPTIYRGYSPIFGLLTLFGLAFWRRVYLRIDHQAILLSALGLFAGMWIAIWCVHDTCPRYVLSAIILGVAWPALGLLSLSQWCARGAAWAFHRERVRRLALHSPLAISLFAGVVSIALTNPARLDCERRAGLWIRQQGLVPARIVGPTGATTLFAYYSGVKDYYPFSWNSDDPSILATVRNCTPDMVILRLSKRFSPERCKALIAQLEPLGFQELPESQRPSDCEEVYLLKRQIPPVSRTNTVRPALLPRVPIAR